MLSGTVCELDLCSFSLTVARAAATEETEGLDLLPVEPRASLVEAEDELADDECLAPSLSPLDIGNLERSSESSQADSSPRVVISLLVNGSWCGLRVQMK